GSNAPAGACIAVIDIGADGVMLGADIRTRPLRTTISDKEMRRGKLTIHGRKQFLELAIAGDRAQILAIFGADGIPVATLMGRVIIAILHIGPGLLKRSKTRGVCVTRIEQVGWDVRDLARVRD